MTRQVRGSAALLRLMVRRDRVMVPLWILGFVLSAAGSAGAAAELYPDVASRMKAAALLDGSPALRALYGRIYDYSSLGAISLIKLAGIGTALVAVFAVFLVVRHTRADEEAGRTELVATGVVGRFAGLAAALTEAVLASAVLGVLTATALIAAGLDAAGSWAFGAAWASTGIAFAGIAAVAAQVTRSARAARGLAISVLVAAYAVRGLADAEGPAWLGWLSPIGWAQQIRPYAGDRWDAALPLLALAAICAGVAVILMDRRDLGAGLLPDRPGPAAASARLDGPFALAWRLNRASVLGWTAGFAALGLLLGTMVANVGGALSSSSAKRMIEALGGVQGLTDGFVSTELGVLAVFASALGISVVGRFAAEEPATRTEALLSTSVSRLHLLVSHLAVALAAVSLLMAMLGISLGVTHSLSTSDAANLWRDLDASLARLPAAWVMTCLAALSYGLLRTMTWAWALLGAFTLVGVFGDLTNLPREVQEISPYAHVPHLPGGVFHASPLVVLTLVAAALAVAGYAAFERRDVTPS